MTADRTYAFDVKDRLVRVQDKATGAAVSEDLYFAENRRARKTVYNESGAVGKATLYAYDGWQVCEEQDGRTSATEVTYVWGPHYVYELVQFERTAVHPHGAGKLYTHQDARKSVVAVTDDAANVVERNVYDDFGNASRANNVDNPYLFQGRRFDPETGFYYFRNRYYDPSSGRFLQRDPVWDAENVGNQYSFAGNGPVSRVDPTGMYPPELRYHADLAKWKILAQTGDPHALAQVHHLQKILGIESKSELIQLAHVIDAIPETFASGEAYQSFAQGCASVVNLMSMGFYGDPEERARELEAEGFKRPTRETESATRLTGRYGVGLPLMVAVGFKAAGPLAALIQKIPYVSSVPYLAQILVQLGIWGDEFTSGRTSSSRRVGNTWKTTRPPGGRGRRRARGRIARRRIRSATSSALSREPPFGLSTASYP